MKKIFLLLGGLLPFMLVTAQHRITFIIDHLPAYHLQSEPVFLAGSFNRWNPGDTSFLLKEVNTKRGITIDLPKGMFEYKFTRGSWDKAESGDQGASVPNRRISVNGDDTVHIRIEHWTDHFPKQPVRSTASRNVHVVDTSFYIPQLKRNRRVWIYLPENYNRSSKRYPVLYMHDGQNVFDAATSGYGEWGVDEALDTLGEDDQQLIVVAIDHGGDKRLNEYAPYDMDEHGRGEGKLYAEFLVKTLKPFIDRHYRTRKCRKHTFIAGSSMGGLISFYSILHYPNVFGAAGVFSPAFWINPEMMEIDPSKARRLKGRIYFYGGRQESESMVPDMLKVFQQMEQHSKAKMQTVIRAEGRHNEPTWREEFVKFYQWLFKR